MHRMWCVGHFSVAIILSIVYVHLRIGDVFAFFRTRPWIFLPILALSIGHDLFHAPEFLRPVSHNVFACAVAPLVVSRAIGVNHKDEIAVLVISSFSHIASDQLFGGAQRPFWPLSTRAINGVWMFNTSRDHLFESFAWLTVLFFFVFVDRRAIFSRVRSFVQRSRLAIASVAFLNAFCCLQAWLFTSWGFSSGLPSPVLSITSFSRISMLVSFITFLLTLVSVCWW